MVPPKFTEEPSPELKSTSSPPSNFEKGRSAERKVGEELEAQGFFILKKNWRTPYGEVDLVAIKEDCLWILEIKTQTERLQKVRSPLGYAQQKRLTRAAQWIWIQNRKKYKKFRCRLIVVTERGMKCLTLPLLYDQA